MPPDKADLKAKCTLEKAVIRQVGSGSTALQVCENMSQVWWIGNLNGWPRSTSGIVHPDAPGLQPLDRSKPHLLGCDRRRPASTSTTPPSSPARSLPLRSLDSDLRVVVRRSPRLLEPEQDGEAGGGSEDEDSRSSKLVLRHPLKDARYDLRGRPNPGADETSHGIRTLVSMARLTLGTSRRPTPSGRTAGA